MTRVRDMWPEILGAFFALLVIIACLAACTPKCPKCAVPTASPPVVTVVRPPPCSLPSLPEPIKDLGTPDAPRGGYFVSNANWALLAGHEAAIRAWIVAAAGCFTSGALHP